MERNWETIREILIRLDEKPASVMALSLSDFPEDRHHEISYHVTLLEEAGLIQATLSRAMGQGTRPTPFFLRRMTWSGHELLDSIRSDTVWNKTKKSFAASGARMTFELVKTVAVEVTKELIKLQPGV